MNDVIAAFNLKTERDLLHRALSDVLDQIATLEGYELTTALDLIEAEACWDEAINHAKAILRSIAV